ALRCYGFASPASAKSPLQSRTKRQLWFSAWLGSALVAFNLQILVWSHTGVSDMLLTGCMGTAMLCFFLGYASQNKPQHQHFLTLPRPWYLAFYLLISLAVLTKGPVGIVIPGLVIIAFLVYVGQFWAVVKEAQIITGGAIFLLITLPWYILVSLENSDYLASFFGYHNFERFTEVVNGHNAPWYFYFLVILVGFLPYSVYLPWGIVRLKFWRPSFWRRQPRSAQLSLFAMFWLVIIFAFFTLAVTKLPSYTLPLIPAAAIIVALLWSEQLTQSEPELKRPTRPSLLWSGILNILLMVAVAIALGIGPGLIGYDPAAPNLGTLFADTKLHRLGAAIWMSAAVGSIIVLLKNK
ncbi:MAG: glycosyltransferase, partial [Okeania sp. SIO2D1]|nr:glycosyltransferase [Okeania sp. SIO2D1]